MTETTTWQAAAQEYLQRLGIAEYKEGLASHVKRRRKASTYRHNPSEYHRNLVRLLGEGDEEAFKYYKGMRGQDSSIGC